MVSARGMAIGLLVIALGIFVIYTFISYDFLYSIGIDTGAVNAIHEQWGIWGPAIGVAIIIAGLVAMGQFN
jgi:hypothetical protein